jgi:lipid II:glycine glycyltransferase (peptidoglycan interpeptide bridge formation enzyme)
LVQFILGFSPFRVTRVTHGPVIEGPEAAQRAAIESVLSTVQGTNISFTPNIYAAAVPWKELSAIFKRHGYAERKYATVLLQLTDASIDKIFSSFDKRLRNNIKKTLPNVSFVLAQDTRKVEDCYAVYRENALENSSRDGVSIMPYAVYETLFRDHRKYADFFVLYDADGTALASQFATHHDGIVYLSGVAISSVARKQSIPANDVLQWKIIEWYAQRGATVIDWVGYTLNAPHNSKHDRVNRFKLKFGGSVVEYRVFERWGRCMRLAKYFAQRTGGQR